MSIPTEPIGSIPRTSELLEALANEDALDPKLDTLYETAIQDTIERFEATGSPVITDGEQRKYHNFWTYSVDGLANTAPDGFTIPFTGHQRRMPKLTSGPFRYRIYATSIWMSRCVLPATRQAGVLTLGSEPHVSSDRDRRYSRAEFVDDLCGNTKQRCAAASTRARTRFR